MKLMQQVQQLIFIDPQLLPIKNKKMATIENNGEIPTRKIMSNFKSTSYIQTNTHCNKLKVRRDMSTISNYYVNTQRKTPDPAITRLENKTLLQSYLPEINSKHRAQKRSSFLQMWLDQALDPQDNVTKETSPLRTIQKFEIDKKYLKSQNMSGQLIDKLYNSLYVYTYGINNTFNEIVSLTKVNEHAEKRIVNSFWKAFIKLLEGCTSFRTTFQVIQQTYQKQMIEIRQNFSIKQVEYSQERKRLQQQINKLNKKISEQSYTISKLTNDYKISQSTLHLTDQAFNEQVNLRLKFQEKVNAIFTSYEEIRIKYNHLLQDLDVKGDEELSARQMLIDLRAQIQQSQIKNIQLSNQIERYKQQIKERQAQLSLKFQQIYQINGKVAQYEARRDDNQEQVRKLIIKLDHFRQQKEIHLNQIKIKAELIKQYEKRISEQQKVIQRTRSANQSVYQRYENAGKIIGDFNAQRLVLLDKAKSAEAELQIYKEQKLAIEVEKNSLLEQIKKYQHQIKDLRQELDTKNSFIQHNSELIRNLQSVKDKFETMYSLTSSEKKKMEQIMNEAVRMKQIFEEEMVGMKMLLQNRNTELNEANNKLENEREVFRSKISSLKEQISAKDDQILDFHNKQLEDQQILSANSKKLTLFQTQNVTFRQEVLQLQSQLVQKEILLKDGSLERDKARSILKELNTKLQQISKEKSTNEFNLSNKTSLLQQLRGRADKQKQVLRALLQSYRQDRQKKVAYVHPMLFEDCRAQIDRNTHKIQDFTAQKQVLQETVKQLNQKVQQSNDTITLLKNGLLKSQAQNQKKLQIIVLLENTKHQIEQTLIQNTKGSMQNETKNQQKLKQYQKDHQQQKFVIINLKQELQASNLLIKNQKSALDKLQDQRKIQNIHHMAQEDEISNMKADIARLKQELGAARRGDSKGSSRAQALKRKGTSNQQRQSNSRNQERQSISTSKLSNYQEIPKSQQKSLRTIRQQSPSSKKVQIKEIQVEVRPSTVQKQAQTEKQKPKFSHSFRFEQIRPTYQDYGCQIQIAQQSSNNNQNLANSANSHYKLGRIEGQEFKRALKITYMRR